MSTILLVVTIAVGFATALLIFLEVEGSLIFKILHLIFRGVVFFAIFYNPLIEQPRVLDVMR